MKKLTFIILLLISSNIFPQDISRIYLKSGHIIKGRIIETIPDESITIELKGGLIYTYQLSDVTMIETIPICKMGSVGAGLGVPYGVLGLNGEYAIADNVNLTAGIGTTILAGAGYNIGIKYYLKDVGNAWRPRISAYYGINGIIIVQYAWSSEPFIEEVHSGLTLGIGTSWMWGDAKKHGIDLDIMYIATSGYFERKDELEEKYTNISWEEFGRVKISIGFRYGF